jgi:hypothetical protein
VIIVLGRTSILELSSTPIFAMQWLRLNGHHA